MTTIAMVAGMVPSALSFGAGGEFRSPMAIAVIGGLTVSTFLSLLFVPAFFTIVDDFGRLCWRLFGRFIGKADEPAPAEIAKPPIESYFGHAATAPRKRDPQTRPNQQR
jgi:hypothetical protein